MQDFAVRYFRYEEVVNRLDERAGEWGRGELELVRGFDNVHIHENTIVERLKSKGQAPDMGRIGVMYEDQYVYLLRDPVIFPPKSGTTEPILATYIRLIYKNRLAGNPGIFILSANRRNELVLNRNFRHATRCWLLDGQGTIGRNGESREASVARCVCEELGGTVKELVLLTGSYISERGLLGDRVPMYFARVEASGPIEDPTIAGHVRMTAEAYAAALLNGSHAIDGLPHHLHEGYTMSAFLLARLRGLL